MNSNICAIEMPIMVENQYPGIALAVERGRSSVEDIAVTEFLVYYLDPNSPTGPWQWVDMLNTRPMIGREIIDYISGPQQPEPARNKPTILVPKR